MSASITKYGIRSGIESPQSSVSPLGFRSVLRTGTVFPDCCGEHWRFMKRKYMPSAVVLGDVDEQLGVLGEVVVVVLDHAGSVRVSGQGDGCPDDRVHRDEDRELEEEGQAAAEGVDPVLLIQLHRLLLDLLLVPLVLLLDLLDLRLQGLHGLHRLDLLDAEGEQHDPEDDREDDDREAEVAREVVEPGEQPPDRVEQRLERRRSQRAWRPPRFIVRSSTLCMAASYVEW